MKLRTPINWQWEFRVEFFELSQNFGVSTWVWNEGIPSREDTVYFPRHSLDALIGLLQKAKEAL